VVRDWPGGEVTSREVDGAGLALPGCPRRAQRRPGTAWGGLDGSLLRGTGLGCQQGDGCRLGVSGGGVVRSERGEG
jgi:hypothetical protein